MKGDGIFQTRGEIDSQITLIENLIKGFQSIKGKTPQEKAFLNKLNQLHKQAFSPENILKEYNKDNPNLQKIDDLIFKDTFTLVSWNRLTKDGFNVYKALEKAGIKDPESAVDKLLDRIAYRATEIKLRKDNRGDSEELTDSIPREVDSEVALLKTDIAKAALNNKISFTVLERYLDSYLLSPFHHKSLRKSDFISGQRKSAIGNYTFQSQSISKESIKSFMKEYDNIYASTRKEAAPESVKPEDSVEISKIEQEIFSPPKDYTETTSTTEAIQVIENKDIDKVSK